MRLLYAIDSGSYGAPSVNAIHDWLAARLAELGFTVTRHAGDALGCHLLASRMGASPRRLLLGHADTVYPARHRIRAPHAPARARLLGPGSPATHEGGVTGLCALAALDALELGPLGTVHFLSVGDEEDRLCRARPFR
ncbi:MAG: M20/M25/M40 family metallo-hydrolase [Caldilineaceae bacterium]